MDKDNVLSFEGRETITTFIGQIIHPQIGRIDGDTANRKLQRIFGSGYWMRAQTWAIVNEAHAILFKG